MFPKVVRVIPTEEYTVYVYFEDGKTATFSKKSKLDYEVL